MSANEETLIDTLCPHGSSEHQPVELCFLEDAGRWADEVGVIYHPDGMDSQWIAADRDAFVEVGSR
jgi:hypothetical protein